MFLLNGKPLAVDMPFQIDGTSYPANWLRLTSLEEKNAVGITEVPDVTETYDSRFYWGVDNPKQLENITVTPEGGEPYVQKGMKSNWTATSQGLRLISYWLRPIGWSFVRQSVMSLYLRLLLPIVRL